MMISSSPWKTFGHDSFSGSPMRSPARTAAIRIAAGMPWPMASAMTKATVLGPVFTRS